VLLRANNHNCVCSILVQNDVQTIKKMVLFKRKKTLAKRRGEAAVARDGNHLPSLLRESKVRELLHNETWQNDDFDIKF
jgi:hypothetical protein